MVEMRARKLDMEKGVLEQDLADANGRIQSLERHAGL
jgi:hypothetical protein